MRIILNQTINNIESNVWLGSSHLDLALRQVCVRSQTLPQCDVRVGSDSEGLLQL